MSTYSVTIECPRCSTEMSVEVHISGGYAPARGPSYASGGEPAEYPDIDCDAPHACAHVPDEDTEFMPGPYTSHEILVLNAAIEAKALEYAQGASEYHGPDTSDEEER